MKTIYYVLFVIIISLLTSCGQVEVEYISWDGDNWSSLEKSNDSNDSDIRCALLDLRLKQVKGEISEHQYEVDRLNLMHQFNVKQINNNAMVEFIKETGGYIKPIMTGKVNKYVMDFENSVVKVNGQVIFE